MFANKGLGSNVLFNFCNTDKTKIMVVSHQHTEVHQCLYSAMDLLPNMLCEMKCFGKIDTVP